MPTLYVVPTPIGNLEDITLRALRILREVSLIAAEDTRTTKILLDHYQITTPLISYHEHNKLARLDQIFIALQKSDIALVSDAGTPGISDPGYELIQAAISQDIHIVALPGANAATTALVVSGLPTDSYIYLGFPPRKTNQIRLFIENIRYEKRTLIFYESPHRLNKTLAVLYEILGDRLVAMGRELTKFYEEVWRGDLSRLIEYCLETPPRGEVTLVVGGMPSEEGIDMWEEEKVRAVMAARLAEGEKRSEIVRSLAVESGWDRRTLYDLDV